MGKQHDTDKAIRNLLKWIDRPEWLDAKLSVFDDHLVPVIEYLDITPEELIQELDGAGYMDMLNGMMLEDFFSCRFDPDSENVIDDYLKHRGWRESVRGRRYLEQLRDSVLSLYEVVELERGKHCDIKDLIRNGKPVRVYERMGTQNLVKWDRLAARIVKLDGKHYFTGGILPLQHEVSNDLLEHLNQQRKVLEAQLKKHKKRVTKDKPEQALPVLDVDAQILRDACPVITMAWLVNIFGALQQPFPILTNTSGDELAFTDTYFPYNSEDRNMIIQRLHDAVDWIPDDDEGLRWVWHPRKKMDATKNRSSGLAIETFQGGENTIYGSLVIKPQQINFAANSLERAEQGKKLLQTLLNDLIGEPLTKIETPEQMLSKTDEQSMRSSGQSKSSEIDPEIEAVVIQKMLDTHYRKCLDEKIPALDDKTPRQCVKSKAGRKKVIEWLKYLENQEQRRANKKNMAPYDSSWMWQELGIEREDTPCT